MAIGDVVTHVRDAGQIYSAGAGVEWDKLVEQTVREGCAGLECLSGIPGSVGGTPVQNVGAYGQEVAETILRVHAVEISTGGRVIFERAECGFRYRQSRFNRSDTGRYILTRVEFALHPGGAPKIAYADLQRHFRERLEAGVQPTPAEVREAVLATRRSKGMVLDESDPDSHSAGSFFKNPVVSRGELERISAASPDLVPHYDAGEDQVKLAAAWLIEHAGIARGFALGPAAISRKHTLALVNLGGATAADILRLKELVQSKVFERFGVELHPEPVMLGFDSAAVPGNQGSITPRTERKANC
jgi:UDP-N-acetylmuramate dehydrogenase